MEAHKENARRKTGASQQVENFAAPNETEVVALTKHIIYS